MAVIAHLENDLSGEQAWHTIASQWPEEDADVDYWIGLKLSQKYRFTEGSSYQRRALVKNPLHTRARIQLSQDLLRLGKVKEGWQLADAVSRSRSRNSRSSFSLNRPLAFPNHRCGVHIVHRTLRRRFPAVLLRRLIVDRMGVESITPTLQGSVVPNGMPAHFKRGPLRNRTRSPSLPRTCAATTPADQSSL
jgi:hypothetical protein